MSNEPVKRPVPTTKKHVARLQREQQQTRLILYVFFGILAAIVLLVLYGWLDARYFQLQRPVAKVGDTKILVRDFEPRVRLYRQQLLNDYSQYVQYSQFFGLNVDSQLQQITNTLNSPASIGQSVLDQMINEEIIRQEAAKRGITVSQQELDEAVQDAFGYYPNGTPTPPATPTEVVLPEIPAEAYQVVTITPTPSPTSEFTATPEAPSNGTEGPASDSAEEDAASEPSPAPTATRTPTASPTPEPEPTATAGPSPTPLPTATPFTLEGFQKALNETNQNLEKFGFRAEYYRAFFEAQLLEKKLRDAITVDVPRTETQVWARHILVSDGQLADELIERLKNGEDFAALAMEYSKDPGSAQNGGDLGWFGSGVMVPEFEAAAFALEKSGDITTRPAQSSFGYHIIQLIAKQDRPLTADEYESRKARAFAEWLVAAKEEYGVEIFDIWRQRVPNEPNFITAATDAANAQLTQQAEFLESFNTTPAP
jgi:parvulin-like peptidyl-prolyl isomerase